jgi:hypothetical protein
MCRVSDCVELEFKERIELICGLSGVQKVARPSLGHYYLCAPALLLGAWNATAEVSIRNVILRTESSPNPAHKSLHSTPLISPLQVRCMIRALATVLLLAL